jgi:hypothetical protein
MYLKQRSGQWVVPEVAERMVLTVMAKGFGRGFIPAVEGVPVQSDTQASQWCRQDETVCNNAIIFPLQIQEWMYKAERRKCLSYIIFFLQNEYVILYLHIICHHYIYK